MNNLYKVITQDGSLSLRSEKYNENFHSLLGALNETRNKFINPSRLERFKNKSLTVLDICFGLGYNSAFLFNKLIDQSTSLRWYGIDIDKRPLNYALNEEEFQKLWKPEVLEILNVLFLKGFYENEQFICNFILGDARQKITTLPKGIKFDLIFLDGFSPQKCPELWSIDFLLELKNKINNNGYLITYSSSAAVRKSLKNLGFKIFTIKPNTLDKNIWSNGTLATFNEQHNNPCIIKLSEMEIEHLKTKASIPYRDPKGNLSPKEILNNRKKEQLISRLLETNLWRKKWEMA